MAIINSRVGQYSPLVQQAAQKYGVPADLINAVIQRESSGMAGAASGTGPVGLMQISRSLASQYGYDPKDRLDPAKNIDMGARYIRDNLKAFGGDVQKAMVGYSEGTGGARQMFAGKAPLTQQAKDSMTNPLFTPFFSQSQQAGLQARQIANPMAALQDKQAQDQFSPQYLQQDQAQAAPTQADVAANAAGVLTPEHIQAIQDAYNGSLDKDKEDEDNGFDPWGQGALMLLAGLSRKPEITNSSASGVGAGRSAGSSQYSPQTLATLQMLNQMRAQR